MSSSDEVLKELKKQLKKEEFCIKVDEDALVLTFYIKEISSNKEFRLVPKENSVDKQTVKEIIEETLGDEFGKHDAFIIKGILLKKLKL